MWPQEPIEKCFQKEAAAGRQHVMWLLVSTPELRGDLLSKAARPGLTTCFKGPSLLASLCPICLWFFLQSISRDLKSPCLYVYLFACYSDRPQNMSCTKVRTFLACVTSCCIPSSHLLSTQCLLNENGSLLRKVQYIEAFS